MKNTREQELERVLKDFMWISDTEWTSPFVPLICADCRCREGDDHHKDCEINNALNS